MTSVKTAALPYLTSTEPKQHRRQDKTLKEYLNADQCYTPTCPCHVFCLVPNHSFGVERTPHTRQAEAEFKQAIKFNDSEALRSLAQPCAKPSCKGSPSFYCRPRKNNMAARNYQPHYITHPLCVEF